jgi:hypothetical protein
MSDEVYKAASRLAREFLKSDLTKYSLNYDDDTLEELDITITKPKKGLNHCQNEIWLGHPHNYYVNCGFKTTEEDGSQIILCEDCSQNTRKVKE